MTDCNRCPGEQAVHICSFCEGGGVVIDARTDRIVTCPVCGGTGMTSP